MEFAYGDQETPFHAASIGKLLTATVVLQLVEEGRIGLDSPVDRLLPAETIAGLFAPAPDAAPATAPDAAPDAAAFGVVGSAGLAPSGPTVLHLLRHVSGANDYFEGRVRHGDRMQRILRRDPDRRWSPSELVAFTRERQTPIGAPGERFRYSDTGFDLLGCVIEEMTGQPYERALHDRVISPLGLERTFLPFRTAPATGADGIAPCCLGRVEMSRRGGLTCGWAGGGVAAAPEDLLRFGRALHGDELLSVRSRGIMADIRNRVRPGIHYGAGMMELRFSEFGPFMRRLPRLRGHLGSLSTALLHDPESDVHLVANFHASGEMSRMVRSLVAIARTLPGAAAAGR
ncbi:serine hydrolase domain-containing protein [Leucobacter sp.]